MPSRFSSKVYEPELTRLMGDALDAAWAEFNPPPKNADLGRQYLTSAIIEAVEDGIRDSKILSARAVRTLDEAIHRDPAKFSAPNDGAPSAKLKAELQTIQADEPQPIK